MPRDIIVIGASAGGLVAVGTVVNGLSPTIEAPVLIVIHTSPEGPGLLSSILARTSPLPITTARQGEPLRNGRVYVAPLDRHLTVQDGYIRLTKGPREHRFRPAIDPLFRTAAEYYGDRAIGIVLSGNMSDGAHGLLTIKNAGGLAIVQDPDEAQAPMMPLSAMRQVKVDHVLPAGEIGNVVSKVIQFRDGHRGRGVAKDGADPPPSPEDPRGDALQTGSLTGPPSPLTCPDCGGALWEVKDGALVRYKCHVGHTFTAETLAAGQQVKLWSALRAIEESIELKKRISERARARNLSAVLPGLVRDTEELEARASSLRALLLDDRSSARPRRARRRSTHGKKKR